MVGHFLICAVRHVSTQPALGISGRLRIRDDVPVQHESTLAIKGVRARQKPGFIFTFRQYNRHSAMWLDATSAIDDGWPELCRAVVIGIEQNEYPTVVSGLGRSEFEILQEFLVLVQKAVTVYPDGFLHLGITVRGQPIAETPQQDRQGSYFSVPFDDQYNPGHHFAPDGSTVTNLSSNKSG